MTELSWRGTCLTPWAQSLCAVNSCSWLFYSVKQTHCELFHRNNFIGEDPLGATSVQVKASKPETCHKGGTTGTQLLGEGKKTLLIWVYPMGILVQGWHCRLGFLTGECGVSWAEPPWAAPPQRNDVPSPVLFLLARLCCFPEAGDTF